jgi:hypothetical protein
VVLRAPIGRIGTTLDRWTLDGGAAYVDRNSYAAFAVAADVQPSGFRVAAWDEGVDEDVAFAAAMQSRNSWLNEEKR